jgi:sigma-B regulation protein RsbU (phosphoserine phosphatase)
MAEHRFAVSIPLDPLYLQSVRQFYGSVLEPRCGAEEAGRIVLALDECCANVIRHRNPAIGDGSIHVEAEVGEAHAVFRLRAFCRRDDVSRIKPRDLEDVRPGGLGTHIVREVMDAVAFEPDAERPECVALVMRKTWTPRPQPDQRRMTEDDA